RAGGGWGERTPSEIREAEYLEKLTRHPHTTESLAGPPSGQIDSSHSIASHRLERRGARLPLGQVQYRRESGVRGGRHGAEAQGDQQIRIGVKERAQQHGVPDGDDSDISAD